MEALPGLRAVRWSGLTGSYGPASDVPAFLSTIAWGGRDAGLGALDRLQLQILPGRTAVSEATPAVIPFLWQLVMLPQVQVKGEILELLREILESRSWASASRGGAVGYGEKVEWESRSHTAVTQSVATATLLGESIDPNVASAYERLAEACRRGFRRGNER